MWKGVHGVLTAPPLECLPHLASYLSTALIQTALWHCSSASCPLLGGSRHYCSSYHFTSCTIIWCSRFSSANWVWSCRRVVAINSVVEGLAIDDHLVLYPLTIELRYLGSTRIVWSEACRVVTHITAPASLLAEGDSSLALVGVASLLRLARFEGSAPGLVSFTVGVGVVADLWLAVFAGIQLHQLRLLGLLPLGSRH